MSRHLSKNGCLFISPVSGKHASAKRRKKEGGEVANEKNLIRLSPSEAREYGRKGGKASGEARLFLTS